MSQQVCTPLPAPIPFFHSKYCILGEIGSDDAYSFAPLMYNKEVNERSEVRLKFQIILNIIAYTVTERSEHLYPL
jgi:hypothetical protein